MGGSLIGPGCRGDCFTEKCLAGLAPSLTTGASGPPSGGPPFGGGGLWCLCFEGAAQLPPLHHSQRCRVREAMWCRVGAMG